MPVSRFVYENGSKIDLVIIHEPSADQYVLRPGEKVELRVCDDGEVGAIELSQFSKGLIVYSYGNSDIEFFVNGERLPPSPEMDLNDVF